MFCTACSQLFFNEKELKKHERKCNSWRVCSKTSQELEMKQRKEKEIEKIKLTENKEEEKKALDSIIMILLIPYYIYISWCIKYTQ